MVVILGVLFVGITFLARSSASSRSEGRADRHRPDLQRRLWRTVGFYLFQAFTALILFLAANTSYNAFPRLAAILAEDGFFPRQFAFRGDRLAFSTGILLLGLAAGAVVIVPAAAPPTADPALRGRRVHRFTIAQTGMVRHWLRKEPGWRYRLAINAVGRCSRASSRSS